MDILLLSSKNDEDDSGLDRSCARFDDRHVSVGGVTQATELCFLDDSLEWAAMTLNGEINFMEKLLNLDLAVNLL